MSAAAPRRVLIVDDSSVVRGLVRAALAREPRLQVVGEAAGPFAARRMIRALNPDVLVLDIEMPGMDGVEFLRRLMRLRPMPVVMLSGLAATGSARAVEALAIGAIDCLEKAADLFEPESRRLCAHVLAAANAATGAPQRKEDRLSRPGRGRSYRPNGRIVLIGASTGGVEALEALLHHWPVNGPPVLVAQHMPNAYLARFAARLDAAVAPGVAIAHPQMALTPGRVWFAPGGARDLILRRGPAGPMAEIVPRLSGIDPCPSVGRLFASALPWAETVAAAILTGMGRDGAAELAGLRRAGARTAGTGPR